MTATCDYCLRTTAACVEVWTATDKGYWRVRIVCRACEDAHAKAR